MYENMHIFTYICNNMKMCVRECVCNCKCESACSYVHVHVHAHTHGHVHIQVYVHVLINMHLHIHVCKIADLWCVSLCAQNTGVSVTINMKYISQEDSFTSYISRHKKEHYPSLLLPLEINKAPTSSRSS